LAPAVVASLKSVTLEEASPYPVAVISFCLEFRADGDGRLR